MLAVTLLNEKLMASTLYQRIGRAARGKDIEGIAVIYVQKSLLDSIGKKNWVETMAEWQGVWMILRHKSILLFMTLSKNWKAFAWFRCRRIEISGDLGFR